MDLLDQYQKQKGTGVDQKVIYAPVLDDGSLEGGGAIIKFLVKISGGRIQSTQSANVVLAVVAIALFVLAFYMFFVQSSQTAVPSNKEETRIPGTF